MHSPFDRFAIAFTALALVGVLGVELRRVDGLMPYPQHVDERPVLNAAAQMLKTGSWNPHLYQYPSLPLYMASGALALGLISASGRGPDKLSTQQIGRLAGGSYEHPEVVRMVRCLWAALGVVTIAASAAVGFQLGGGLGLLLALACALVGTKIRLLASGYVNVDTPAATFAALCIWRLLAAIDRPRRSDKLWISALCGAAMACKYNALVVLVPCVVAVVLFSRRDRVRRSIAITLASLAWFVVFCPYFLLDFTHFVDGLAGVAYHYGSLGHRRFTVEPGLPHLALIASDVTGDYGYLVALAALVGCVFGPLRGGRRVLLVASLPIAAALSMSRTQVHFGRNSLIVLAMVPPLAACGVRVLWSCLTLLPPRLAAVRRLQWLTARRASLLLAFAAIGAFLAALPIHTLIENYRVVPDSRNALVGWARKNLAGGAVLLIPTSIPIDADRLRGRIEVRALNLRNAEETRALATAGSYVLLPHWFDGSASAVRQLAELAPGLDALPPRTLVQRFDGQRIRPIEGQDIQCVNPGFDIVRLDARTEATTQTAERPD